MAVGTCLGLGGHREGEAQFQGLKFEIPSLTGTPQERSQSWGSGGFPPEKIFRIEHL